MMAFKLTQRSRPRVDRNLPLTDARIGRSYPGISRFGPCGSRHLRISRSVLFMAQLKKECSGGLGMGLAVPLRIDLQSVMVSLQSENAATPRWLMHS